MSQHCISKAFQHCISTGVPALHLNKHPSIASPKHPSIDRKKKGKKVRKKEMCFQRVWWHTPLILALRERSRWDLCEFKANQVTKWVGYLVRHCLEKIGFPYNTIEPSHMSIHLGLRDTLEPSCQSVGWAGTTRIFYSGVPMKPGLSLLLSIGHGIRISKWLRDLAGKAW